MPLKFSTGHRRFCWETERDGRADFAFFCWRRFQADCSAGGAWTLGAGVRGGARYSLSVLGQLVDTDRGCFRALTLAVLPQEHQMAGKACSEAEAHITVNSEISMYSKIDCYIMGGGS